MISALAFLLLPSPQRATGSDYQSLVAGVMATPSSRPDGCDGGYRATQADDKAELPKSSRALPVPTPAPSPEPLVEAVETLPSASLAHGGPAGPNEVTRLVEVGETLWGIAAASGVTVAELAARNGLSEDALVMAGDVLVIPATQSASP